MEKIELKHKEIVEFCHANSDESVIKKYSRYIKQGYDAYGIDSKILVSQKTKWVNSWEDEMTIYDYLNFERTGKWLENGIQNWANTDVLCMLVLSEFIFNEIVQPKDFTNCTESKSKWKRRAVPVTFVEAIKKGHKAEPILSVVEKLMLDEEEDVQKGLGTLLREIWKKHPDLAETFLLKWKDKCGRKIIQYATEKMDKNNKTKFKKVKK